MAAPMRDGEYWFDEEAATAAVNFFPDNLVLTKGEWRGRPFVLEPWQQERIIRPLFGWKRADGTRRYRRCFVWVARKNGKTELAAGVAILLLVADGEPAGEVYAMATKEQQARIVYRMAADMIGMSPTLADHVTVFKNALFCSELSSSLTPMSGIPKGAHGYSPSGLIGDEVHEWTHDRLYTFLHQGEGARRQPLEFMISSAGEIGGIGEQFFRECQGIEAGEIDDRETLVVIFQADEERHRADPDYWKTEEARRAANPNFGISPKAEYLEAECKAAIRLPRKQNDFLRYHLNLWVEQTTRWLPMDAWRDCGQPIEYRAELRAAAEQDRPVAPAIAARLIPAKRENGRWRSFAEKMKGRKAWGGLDLSSTTDLSCLAWIFPPEKYADWDEGLWTILPRFFVPEVGIKTRSRRDKVPYTQWASAGALFPTPGNAVDYAYIKRQLYADAELFDVQTVAVDRWNATQTVIELNAEDIDAALFGQGFASMSEPAKFFETLVINRQLDHGGQPVLAWNARNVAVETDAAENIKPSKKVSRERIDGIVAGVMGIGAARAAPKEADLGDFLSDAVIA